MPPVYSESEASPKGRAVTGGGRELIDVDQSVKIEQLHFDTIVAFSNEEQYCIKLPRKIKRELYIKYKRAIGQLRYKLFTICVFYCIKDYIKIHKEIELVICCEYSGKENLIKDLLIKILSKNNFKINKELISFGRIGKKSNAHIIAIDTFRKNRKPNRILKEEDIIKFLQ